jgi:hypothetical protein
MSNQWESDLVENPFCQQLRAMGWQWIEGDTDVPEFTERAAFSEVLLKGRLATALGKLNLRDGQPWLDEDRIRRIVEKLEKAEGHRLMEINESATRLLLKGTEIDGLPDWNFGRNQPVRFIDFEIPANNDFLVINHLMVWEAAEFMERHRARPFFIYYALNTPHYPYQGDAKWLESSEHLPYPRNLCAAFVAAEDKRLGALIAKVDALGLRERTLIVFQSDNGHSTAVRAHIGGGSAGPYRGAKFSLFEGGIRLPAILSVG